VFLLQFAFLLPFLLLSLSLSLQQLLQFVSPSCCSQEDWNAAAVVFDEQRA
jgi:hypothetical protein